MQRWCKAGVFSLPRLPSLCLEVAGREDSGNLGRALRTGTTFRLGLVSGTGHENRESCWMKPLGTHKKGFWVFSPEDAAGELWQQLCEES